MLTGNQNGIGIVSGYQQNVHDTIAIIFVVDGFATCLVENVIWKGVKWNNLNCQSCDTILIVDKTHFVFGIIPCELAFVWDCK